LVIYGVWVFMYTLVKIKMFEKKKKFKLKEIKLPILF